MTTVGTVASIVRYPVKSMAGEQLPCGFLGFSGLFGDRVFAFVQDKGKAGFPWFTIRDLEDLVLYKPSFADAAKAERPVDLAASMKLGPGVAPLFPNGDAFDVTVETPTGTRHAIRSDELKTLLEDESGRSITLRFSERSQGDCRPVSMIANSTIAALGNELGMTMDPRRFRANLYVEWTSSEPYFENSLIGQTIRIGERAQVMLTERDPRCKIVTIDPETGNEDSKVLRHITATHGGFVGVYGAVLFEGEINVGDAITLA